MRSLEMVDRDPAFRDQAERAWHFIRRAAGFWRGVLVWMLVGACGSVLALLLIPRTYRSETVLLGTEGVRPVEATEQLVAPRNAAARIQELLTSRQQLSRVIEEFGLYAEIRRKDGPVDAVEEMRKHVQFRAPGGDTFRIGFDGASAEEAQRVTARLAELVMEADLGLRRAEARGTQQFLADEKKGTEHRLREAEAELAAFLALHPRFAADTTPLQTGAAVRATSARIPAVPNVARRRVPLSRSTEGSSILPPSAGEPTRDVAMAQAGVVAARAHLADKLAHFTPAHPDVRAAQAAVDVAETRLASLRSEPAIASSTASSRTIEPSPRPARGGSGQRAATSEPLPEARTLVTLETEWNRLTRSMVEARLRHDQVEAALFRADMVSSSESGGRGVRLAMIDPAFLPQHPLPPGRTLIVLAVMALATGLGVAMALLRAALDDHVESARDLEALGNILVEIPAGRLPRRAHGTA